MRTNDAKLLDGLAALEGFILSSTPPPASDEERRSGSTEPSDARRGSAAQQASAALYSTPSGELEERGTSKAPAQSAAFLASHLAAGSPHLPQQSGPTLAFFLQVATSPAQQCHPTFIAAAVLPQPSPPPLSQSALGQPLSLSCPSSSLPPFVATPPPTASKPNPPNPNHQGALRRPTEQKALPADPFLPSSTVAAPPNAPPSSWPWHPGALHRTVLLLNFNSPAATHAALVKLHAAALAAPHGCAALAALQPVPLVARVLANAAAAGDHVSAERSAAVLLALFVTAGLPLPDDVAGKLVVPAAVHLLSGGGAAAAAAAAAVVTAAAAAEASGTLSSTGLHVRLGSYPTAAAVASTAAPLPRRALPAQASTPPSPPTSCRLAASRLLLHLATYPAAPSSLAISSLSGGSAAPGGASLGLPSTGLCPSIRCERLVSAGALEACCQALDAASAAAVGGDSGAAELQCRTLQLLAALTADVTGWPWQWPVVRAAAVDGCARHAVAIMQLSDGGGAWGSEWAGGSGGNCGGEGCSVGSAGTEAAEAEAHAAARCVVVHLSRGPLLVREALARAGAMSPVVEAVMMWPPPAPLASASAGSVFGGCGDNGGSRQHFSLCLGVLLSLSSLPRVRAALASPALAPLLGHLLQLLEQQPWEAAAAAAGGGGGRPPPSLSAGEQGTAVAAMAADVRGSLLELLLNLALDPQCHTGLMAQDVPALLVGCVAAGQQLRLGPPGPGQGLMGQGLRVPAAAQQQQQTYQQPWRAAAALRLAAALAADPRVGSPRPAMQSALAAAGGLQVVAHELQSAVAALRSAAAACGGEAAAAAAAAYNTAGAALCAMITGNGELQARAAAIPELLTALSAALALPAVARSDARLWLTLAAWRLITAPLAAPGADPWVVGRSLLLSLGHNLDSLRPSAGAAIGGRIGSRRRRSSGNNSKKYDLAQQPLPGFRRQPRASVLMTAAELRRRLSNASASGSNAAGGGSCDGALQLREGTGAAAAGSGVDHFRATSAAAGNASRVCDSSLAAATAAAATVKGAAAGLISADFGGGGSQQAVWTGPLLPGTPLPPPGAAPPDVAPLALPSCVMVAAESRPASSRGEGGEESSRSMLRPRSRSVSMSKSIKTADSAGEKPSSPRHRAAGAASGADKADFNLDGHRTPAASGDAADLSCVRFRRSGSNRLAAMPPCSASLSPLAPLPPLDGGRPLAAAIAIPQLPGAVPQLPGAPMHDALEDAAAATGTSTQDGGCYNRSGSTSSRRRSSAGIDTTSGFAGAAVCAAKVLRTATPAAAAAAAAAGGVSLSEQVAKRQGQSGRAHAQGAVPPKTQRAAAVGDPRLSSSSNPGSGTRWTASSGAILALPRSDSIGSSASASSSCSSSSALSAVTSADKAGGGKPSEPKLMATAVTEPFATAAASSLPVLCTVPPASTANASSTAASTATVIPAVEMSPPLLCLVTHLQALLQGRPACRAAAALVLVQLARLDVIRRSAVMAAGWSALMEAVTTSLTAGVRVADVGERSGSGSAVWGGPLPGQYPVGQYPVGQYPASAASATASNSSSAASGGLPTDPRDKLALLEVMAVAAAGPAWEGRAATLTAPPVIEMVCDLACGLGPLAASLVVGGERPRNPNPARYPGTANAAAAAAASFSQSGVGGGGSPYSLPYPRRQSQYQQQQQQQPYLSRAQMLATEILGDLLDQPRVAAQLEDCGTGAILADRQVYALASAVQAAESAAAAAVTASSTSGWLPSSEPGIAAAAAGPPAAVQQRMRNAASRLLLRLASHVACARECLARPAVVADLLDLLSHLWDAHSAALVPSAAPALLPRTDLGGLSAAAGSRGGGSFNGLGLGRTSRPGVPLAAAAAALDASFTGGTLSGSTSESNLNLSLSLALANRRSSNLAAADSNRRLSASGGGTPPASAMCSPTGRPGGLFASAAPLSQQLSRQLSQQQQPQSQLRAMSPSALMTAAPGSVVSRLSGAGGGGMLAPHGVPTRMSLLASQCTETSQWTSPAHHAMKALELSSEVHPPGAVSLPSSAATAVPMGAVRLPYRQAHTHTGSLVPLRPSPLSARSRARSSRHGAGATTGGDEDGDSVLTSRDDSFAMLDGVAPPPRKPPPPPPSAPPRLPPHRLRGRMAEVAFVADSCGSDGGDGTDANGGGDSSEEHDGFSVMPNNVLRRGTRALAPTAGLPSGASASNGHRSAAAAAAAQCASDLLHLLALLAEEDDDAARAMSTLPCMELFVDLLASSSAPLVLSSMGLLQQLAARQDAHETFWDCDAVAQLVRHLQMRSAAAAVAAMAAAAHAEASSPSPSATATAAAAAAASTVVEVQLGAARVLERLCGDPDLHGRLAATELPAALMAAVKRCADQGHGGQGSAVVASASAGQPQAVSSFLALSLPRVILRASSGGAAAAAGGAIGDAIGGATGSGGITSALLVCALLALASLLDFADVRRQARERRFPLLLGVLAAGGGGGDPGVARLAARCGEKLRDEPAHPAHHLGTRARLATVSGGGLSIGAPPS